jgi:hypothetical protein
MICLKLGIWVLLAATQTGTAQTVIAGWNFENPAKRDAINSANFIYTADDGIAVNVNSAPILLNGPVFFAWNQGFGGSGFAANSQNWLNGAGNYHWLVRFATQGYESLTISSAQRTSATQGPRDFVLQYSLDGLFWTDLTTIISGSETPNWSGIVDNFPLPSILNNKAEIHIRWLQATNFSLTDSEISGPGGTNRIDNIIIRGTPISNPVAGIVSGAQSVCSGETPNPLTLTGSSGDIQWESSTDGNNWNPIGGANAEVLYLGSLTQTTFYRAAVTSGNTKYTDPVTITVKPNAGLTLFSEPVTTSQIICLGDPITHIIFEVQNADGAKVDILPAGLVESYDAVTGRFTVSGTPETADNYSFTISTVDGCGISNADIQLHVNSGPQLSLSSGSLDQSLCLNEAIEPIVFQVFDIIELYADKYPPGVKWEYEQANGTYTISGTPTEPGNTIFTITAGNECGQIIKIGSIMVSAEMTISLESPISTVNQTVCLYQPIQEILYHVNHAPGINIFGLPAGVNAMYDNISGWVMISGTPTESGAFPYTIEPISGCGSSYVEGTLIVNELPEINCPAFDPVCNGAPAIEFPNNGFYYYDEELVTVFPTANDGVFPVEFVFVSDKLCVSSCWLSITVHALPTANAGPDQPIDYGTSTLLSGSAPGVANPQFSWLPTVYIDGLSNIANPQTVPLLENRLFTLTVTDTNGCTNSDQVWVEVDGGPLDASPYAEKDVICLGEPVQLFAGISGGVGIVSYSWYFEYQGSGLPAEFLSDVANPVHVPLYENNVIYSLQVEDGMGSMIEREEHVLVNPLPELPHYDDFSFCANDDIMQYVGLISITGGVLTINGNIEPNFQAVVDGGTGDYDILFTKTDANTGCSHSADFSITIKPVPVADAGAELLEVSYGQSVTLDGASAIPGHSVPLAFSWTPAGLFVNNTVLEPTTIPLTSSAQLTLTVTEDGCSHSDHLQVNVIGGPLTINPVVIPGSICPGEPVTLRAQPSGGFGELANYTYSWTSNRGNFTSTEENPPPVFPEATTTYYLEVRDEADNVAVESVTLTVFEPPVLSCPEPIIIPTNDGIKSMPDINPAGGTFLLEGEEISAIDPVALGEGTHKIFYRYEYGNGCYTDCSFLVQVASPQQYSVSLAIDPPGAGTANGVGNYPAGETVAISASPVMVGWGFDHWSGNVTVSDPLAANTSFVMPANNVNLTAHFKYVWFDISFEIIGFGLVASHPSPYQNFDDIPGPGGNISLPPNGSEYFRFVPDDGYTLLDVIIDGVHMGPIQDYTFSNVSGNHHVIVKFAGSYTIDALAGSGGSISPSGDIALVEGDSQRFDIVPDTGYHIEDVLVDGVSQGAISQYTFTDINSSHTIEALFVINTYTITATAGEGGAISPTGKLVVEHGDSQTYQIQPDECCHIQDVLVDGVSQGAINEYTFADINSSHTIEALFVINTYTITATAGESGTISPTGMLVVEHGDSQTYQIQPDECCHIQDVLVDGVSQGAISEYTFTDINSNHTIEVLFAINTYQLTYVAEPGGVITGDTLNN